MFLNSIPVSQYVCLQPFDWEDIGNEEKGKWNLKLKGLEPLLIEGQSEKYWVSGNEDLNQKQARVELAKAVSSQRAAGGTDYIGWTCPAPIQPHHWTRLLLKSYRRLSVSWALSLLFFYQQESFFCSILCKYVTWLIAFFLIFFFPSFIFLSAFFFFF